MDGTEIPFDVLHRGPRKIIARLVADDVPAIPDGLEQRHSQCTRPGPGLEDPCAGIDIGPLEDHAEVLGIEDLGAAGHLQHVLREGGAEGQHATPAGQGDQGAIWLADQIVVGERLPAELEGVTGL